VRQRMLCEKAVRVPPPAGISIEQAARGDPERSRQPVDHCDCRVTSATLDVADIGSVNASLIGECLLTEALRLTQAPNVSAEPLTDIHAAKRERLSMIVLQTMSDIVC